MNDHEKESLEKRLASWNPELEPDPALSDRVRKRVAQIADKERASIPAWFRIRWLGYAAAAAVLLFGVYFTSQRLERHRLLRDGSYCLMIDPVIRARGVSSTETPAMEALKASDAYIDRLAWMQDRLDLSREQFLQLVDLHDRYGSRFNRLYEELVLLDNEYGAFEELRRKDEVIDFIALYEVLSARRELEGQSHSLSLEFIGKALALLRPEQRPVYLSLVQRTYQTSDG